MISLSLIINEQMNKNLNGIIGHTSYVTSLAVLKDGALASGSTDNTIRIGM